MSVEFWVFLRDERVPSRDEWQREILAAGHDLVLDAFDPRTHAGYLPATFRGSATGFEYYFCDAADIDAVPQDVLEGRNRAISFVVHSDSTELHAAQIAAGVLTSRFGGLYADEDENRLTGNGVFELMAREEAAAAAARVAQAQTDATITSRRCPQCANPCPTYRKTCSVCGYQIGRA